MKISTSIHSTESFGTVDGPGIRYVVFTQGCPLRCKFCHNPDTWKINEGKEMTVDEIMKDVQDYLPFIEASGGGITVSGGEPLLHIDFLIELFKACKEIGVHTCIDTAGGNFSHSTRFMKGLDELMKYTDLVLLDIKHIDPEKHKWLTGMSNEHILDFAHYLSDKHIPVWIRHVLVPGVDTDKDLYKTSDFIHSLPNVEKIEILPYHKLGVYKYEALGIDYPLKGIEPPTKKEVAHAEYILKREFETVK
ncbi:pyruvate formate-lyase-activating enzyme [Weizmannia acidilactici]|uniref:Pyruvate formate-lyase-activating enzyme n=1 Tax=Weizmannia acidilactici TaxID=2607726 RepID=A0A5J4JD55_9BACI|nr:pyruvate formate-lyase-activating protein [Weizmannia acidilactici]GER65873.1 pyruvate formate-lyase-activating enzyme [Weizmannia acidilactici]GER69943.1 pyruvate formate-lyase-activating enzyme [Weizmannia acidilactici]GER73124.1 pyruvate formate-lyase-activating enzyme [Weizmannia acidilactici]